MGIINEGQSTGENPFCFVCKTKIEEDHFFSIALSPYLMITFHGKYFGDCMANRRKLIAREA